MKGENNSMSETTLRADSNFRHFSNALSKRGFSYAAGYVAGLAKGLDSTSLTAALAYELTVDRRALREQLEFAAEFVDGAGEPALAEAIGVLRHQMGANGAAVTAAKQLVPDMFELMERDHEVTVTLRSTQVRRLLEEIPVPDDPDAGEAVSRLRAAIS